MIVADEPTGDLDRDSADEILQILEDLAAKQGKTIVMVTHDPKAAARATRCLQLEKVHSFLAVSYADIPKSSVLATMRKEPHPFLLTLVGVATGMFLFTTIETMQDSLKEATVTNANDTTLVVYAKIVLPFHEQIT